MNGTMPYISDSGSCWCSGASGARCGSFLRSPTQGAIEKPASDASTSQRMVGAISSNQAGSHGSSQVDKSEVVDQSRWTGEGGRGAAERPGNGHQRQRYHVRAYSKHDASRVMRNEKQGMWAVVTSFE